VTAVGTAIVSYIEPSPGYEAAFDDWYGNDHFPSAVLAGPGVISGARFVATDACKALRPREATLFGDPARGTFLAVAWLRPGMQAAWDAWVVETMAHLSAQGRLFPHREHVHTAVYRCGATTGDPTVGGHAGVVALAATGDAPRTTLVPAATLALERTIVSSAGPPAHALVLGFCDRDPLAVFRETPLPTGLGYASPFVALGSRT
jgi:hypothetical protein